HQLYNQRPRQLTIRHDLTNLSQLTDHHAHGMSPFLVEPDYAVRTAASGGSEGFVGAVAQELVGGQNSATDAFLARPYAEFTEAAGEKQSNSRQKSVVAGVSPTGICSCR